MSKYIYNDLIITRDNDQITITDSNGQEKIIRLKKLTQIVGKINLPLSNICNLKCLYCSEAENRETLSVMSQHAAFQIIDEYLSYNEKNSVIDSIRLSFDYGGEPVCQLDLLESVSNYFKKECLKHGKKPIVQITTNASWDSKLVSRVIDCADEIIVSIDGYKELHEKYRIHVGNKSVFDQIIANSKNIYESGKLKNISSVITYETIKNQEKYVSFLSHHFPGAKIKMSAVILTGDAKVNNIERIALSDWKLFIDNVRKIADGKLEILDSKPEKNVDYLYEYGCEHMRMTNWFCWLDGRITCCTDRETDVYVIGRWHDDKIFMDYHFMNKLEHDNHINNVLKCKDCFAKFYCSGGCPLIRDKGINCDRRLSKYAELLVKSAE